MLRYGVLTASLISIHALLAESDRITPIPSRLMRRFLSTLSLRRATRRPCSGAPARPISIHALLAESDPDRPPAACMGGHFYPRSPCGERPKHFRASPRLWQFLSTLSLRRATGILGRRLWYRQQFLSTLSLRRATSRYLKRDFAQSISIHALLAESDEFRGILIP